MDYNKKKDTSINVIRDVTREEVVTVSSIRDLAAGDKIKVTINGEVYEAKVARRPTIGYDYSGESELAIAVNIDKPLSKSWRELGYECFEDMIDDIAKEHGSLNEYTDELTPAEIKWVKDMYRDCAHPTYKEEGSSPENKNYPECGLWMTVCDELNPELFEGYHIVDNYRDCIISCYDIKTGKHLVVKADDATTIYITNKED